MINQLFDHYFAFTDTNEQTKAFSTPNTELGKHKQSSLSTTRPPRRRRLSQQSNGSRDITARENESNNEKYAPSNCPLVPDLGISPDVVENRPVAAQTLTNIDLQSHECPIDYGPRSYPLIDDANDPSGLALAPYSPPTSSIACDDLYVQSGLTDGVVNDGMGAEDWMDLSDYNGSEDKLEGLD